jgi:hypothetical protein
MFWIVLGLLVLTAGSRAGSDKPHIIFILADDVVSLNKNIVYLSHRGSNWTEGEKVCLIYLLKNKDYKRFLN